MVDWFRAVAEGPANLWDPGVAVQLCVPVAAVKGGHMREAHLLRTTDYEPYLIPPEGVGDPSYEDDFLRPLWELYLMEDGARAFLLTPVDGTGPYPSPYLFVASVRSGTEGHGRGKGRASFAKRKKRGFKMGPKSLSDMLKGLVVGMAGKLQLPLDELKKYQGALTLHAARLLFGTHWCKLGEYEFARVRLHHRDAATTRRLYNGNSAATINRTLSLADRAAAENLNARPLVPDPVSCSQDLARIEQLEAENKELKAKLDRTRHTLAAD